MNLNDFIHIYATMSSESKHITCTSSIIMNKKKRYTA